MTSPTPEQIIRQRVRARVATRREWRLLHRYERLGKPKRLELPMLCATFVAASWQAFEHAGRLARAQMDAFGRAVRQVSSSPEAGGDL